MAYDNSQQAAEGNAPGHPLGFDRSQHFGPIKNGGGGEEGATKTTMLQPSVLPDGGVAYTIFVKCCVCNSYCKH